MKKIDDLITIKIDNKFANDDFKKTIVEEIINYRLKIKNRTGFETPTIHIVSDKELYGRGFYWITIDDIDMRLIRYENINEMIEEIFYFILKNKKMIFQKIDDFNNNIKAKG